MEKKHKISAIFQSNKLFLLIFENNQKSKPKNCRKFRKEKTNLIFATFCGRVHAIVNKQLIEQPKLKSKIGKFSKT